MRRPLIAVAFLAVLALALASPSAAHAGSGGSCSVSPDPVPAGTAYTVTWAGLPVPAGQPGTAYAGQMSQGSAQFIFPADTDSAGNGSAVFDFTGANAPAWDAGTVKVKIGSLSASGNTNFSLHNLVATCSFDVTG
jgi:hypothetical protein